MKHPAFRPIFPPVTLDELLAALDADAPQMDYHGISYWRRWHDWMPDWMWTRVIYPLWIRWRCPRGRHLLDEVWSIDEHELRCDACGMRVGIAYVEPGGMFGDGPT